jgi:hypothetical protein
VKATVSGAVPLLTLVVNADTGMAGPGGTSPLMTSLGLLVPSRECTIQLSVEALFNANVYRPSPGTDPGGNTMSTYALRTVGVVVAMCEPPMAGAPVNRIPVSVQLLSASA